MKFRFNYTVEVKYRYDEIFEASTEKEAEAIFRSAREHGELDPSPSFKILGTESIAIKIEEAKDEKI